MPIKIHFTCGKEEAKTAFLKCIKKYGQNTLKNADVEVVLGGDGSILKALHQQIKQKINKPIFGLNYGTKGWMSNDPSLDNLEERIQNALSQDMIPLRLKTTSSANGKKRVVYAFNEFAVLRASPQSAHFKLYVKEKQKVNKNYLEGDGFVVSTPMGSSAYYSVVGGQPLPTHKASLGIHSINTDSHLSTILSIGSRMAVTKLQGAKRPIMIEGDGYRYNGISRAVIESAPENARTLLFDNLRKKEKTI